ncbi:4304_t:CDS:1, partial [Funneliformis mosseae]
NDTRLIKGLNLIKSQLTTGSLASYDNFQYDELYRFMLIYNIEVEDTITDSKKLSDEMITLKKLEVNLPDDVYNLL